LLAIRLSNAESGLSPKARIFLTFSPAFVIGVSFGFEDETARLWETGKALREFLQFCRPMQTFFRWANFSPAYHLNFTGQLHRLTHC